MNSTQSKGVKQPLLRPGDQNIQDPIYPQLSIDPSAVEATTIDNGQEKNSTAEYSDGSTSEVKKGGLGRRALLVFYMIFSALTAAGNTILFKKMLNAYSTPTHNYEFFVNQWTVLLYVVLAAFILAYKMLFTNDVTKEMREFPKKVFVFMGSLDGLSGFLGAVGGAYTPGQLQTLINQTVIPMTLVFSILFLKSKYQRWQYAGAALIMAGAVVATVPQFIGGGSSSSSTKWYAILVFFAGIWPSSFSNVYKEYYLKDDADIDIYYLTVWVASLQVVFGFICAPLLAIPGFGGISMEEVPSQLTDGMLCFLGRNPRVGDDCSGAPWILLAYVFVNFFYNVILLLITKEGSALLLVLSGALALPITNLAFSFEFVMGSETEAFSPWSAVGLALVIVGFLVYSMIGQASEFMVSQGPPGQMVYTPVSEMMLKRRNSHDSNVTRSAPVAITRGPGYGYHASRGDDLARTAPV